MSFYFYKFVENVYFFAHMYFKFAKSVNLAQHLYFSKYSVRVSKYAEFYVEFYFLKWFLKHAPKKLFEKNKPQTDVKSEKLNIRISGLLISRSIFEYFCNFSQ
jgi:hypothetical protein